MMSNNAIYAPQNVVIIFYTSPIKKPPKGGFLNNKLDLIV